MRFRTRELDALQQKLGTDDEVMSTMLEKAADMVTDLQALEYPPIAALVTLDLAFFMAAHLAKMPRGSVVEVRRDLTGDIFAVARDHVSLQVDTNGADLDSPGLDPVVVPFKQ